MAKFKLIVSHPDGKSQIVEIEGTRAQPFVGKMIGENIDGIMAGLPGLKLQITGGSDKDGFPMRQDVHGGVRIAVLLSGGTGFIPTEKGQRRRKLIRGNVITDDIVQINIKVNENGKNKNLQRKQ